MNFTNVKEYLLTVLLIPVAAGLLVIACVQYLLTRSEVFLLECFRKYSVPFFCQAKETPERAAVTNKADAGMIDPSGVYTLLDWLRRRDDNYVNTFRETFEGSAWGILARANNTGRLYAVLHPTKEENIERIEKVLAEMAPDELNRLNTKARAELDKYR